jgi:hypothetical protein|tara:strand:+ start:61 stop:1875 length:1815 start_codon:yes stop_codon:yes gene_type:complete
MPIAEFNKEFEATLTEGGKSRTKSVANTPISQLSANRKVGESKTYTTSFINNSAEFLNAAGLGEYTPAQLADNPQLIRRLVESPAYEKFGKNRANNAQKFLSGIMQAGGFGESWPSRNLKTEFSPTVAKDTIVPDPSRARIDEFPPDPRIAGPKPTIYGGLKQALAILQKENPEAAAQLGLHMFGGFRPEDLNNVELKNINFKTGLVKEIEIKTGSGVQKTSGILAAPLLDIVKQYVGDRRTGLLFENTKNNAAAINKVLKQVFPIDYITVTSEIKGERKEPLTVKRLRNLNETLLTTFGVDEKSDLRKVMTFRAPTTVAGAYATKKANRRRINEVVAKNVAAFVAGSETTSTAQYFSDIGVKASNVTQLITPTKELLEDVDFIVGEDISFEYHAALPEEGNVVSGKAPGQINPEVTEAFNRQAIAQAGAAESQAELARREAELKIGELPETPPRAGRTPQTNTRTFKSAGDVSDKLKEKLAKKGITLGSIFTAGAGAVGLTSFIADPAQAAKDIAIESAALALKAPLAVAGAVPMILEPKELGSGELTEEDRALAEMQKDAGFVNIDRGPEATSGNQEEGFATPPRLDITLDDLPPERQALYR